MYYYTCKEEYLGPKALFVKTIEHMKLILYVKEVVTHFYGKLPYKMGHYFLDTLYKIIAQNMLQKCERKQVAFEEINQVSH